MTKWFEAAFKGGWILSLVSFLFFTFIDPINRMIRIKYVPGRRVYKSDGVTMLLSFVFEVLIRMALYFASILQFVLLMTGASRYCTDVMNVLKPEGHWLFILASVQVISNTVFAVWKIFLLQAEKEESERRIDYGTPLNTTVTGSSQNFSDQTTDEEGIDHSMGQWWNGPTRVKGGGYKLHRLSERE